MMKQASGWVPAVAALGTVQTRSQSPIFSPVGCSVGRGLTTGAWLGAWFWARLSVGLPARAARMPRAKRKPRFPPRAGGVWWVVSLRSPMSRPLVLSFEAAACNAIRGACLLQIECADAVFGRQSSPSHSRKGGKMPGQSLGRGSGPRPPDPIRRPGFRWTGPEGRATTPCFGTAARLAPDAFWNNSNLRRKPLANKYRS